MSRRKTLITVFSIIVVAVVSLINFVQQKYVVPILMYHSINPLAEPKNRLAVSVNTFKRQMHFLKRNHYNVILLQELPGLIKNKEKIPLKTVAITFDDGYKDVYTYAFPILKKYELPATLFIITNEVGRPQGDRLSWDEIKLMQDSGLITFGSHALGPEPLINIKSEQDLKKEIFDSKKILEEKLGEKVNAFSYPEGRFNEHIRKFVIDAGYKLAVATNPGKNYPDDDIFALKRLRISENASNMFVFAVETSGLYTFMKEHRKR